MQSVQLITHWTDALIESAKRRGVDTSARQMSTGAPSGPHWTGADFVFFMKDIGEKLDDAFFGLASAPCPADAPQFGVELMLLSSNLGDALDRFFRFYRLVSDGLTMSLSVDGKDAIISLEEADPAKDSQHFLIEWYTARMITFSQWLTGHEIPELAVEFAHTAQLPPACYAPVLGDNVTFDAPNDRIVLPRRHLDMRVVRTIDDVTSLSNRKFDPEHSEIAHRKWGSRIKNALRSSLYEMKPLPTMEDLARDFGVSSQTLRRRLREEDTSYREIKADARRDVVVNSIADPSLSVGEISVLAGFAEPNGLLRAIKAWTGLSASQYRRVMLESDGDQHGAPDRGS